MELMRLATLLLLAAGCTSRFEEVTLQITTSSTRARLPASFQPAAHARCRWFVWWQTQSPTLTKNARSAIGSFIAE
jgi:hypothetical protein